MVSVEKGGGIVRLGVWGGAPPRAFLTLAPSRRPHRTTLT